MSHEKGKDFTPLHAEQGKVETSRRDIPLRLTRRARSVRIIKMSLPAERRDRKMSPAAKRRGAGGQD